MSNHIENPADNHVHEYSQEKPTYLQELEAEIQRLQKEGSKHDIKPLQMQDLPQVQFSEKGLTRKPHDCIDFVKAERSALDFCRKFRPDAILTAAGEQKTQVHEPSLPEELSMQAAASQTVESIDQFTTESCRTLPLPGFTWQFR